MSEILLASTSPIRLQLLRQAGLDVSAQPPRVDEEGLKHALLAEGAPPRDIADALAEAKAAKVSARSPEPLVLGCDQVLDLDGTLMSKPASPEEAAQHLSALSGGTHRLFTAAVVCQGGSPVWRHVAEVRLTMHALGAPFIEAYVARNWDSVRHAVGAYKLEEEGVRLFSRIEGDYFAVLGLPLLPLLSWLRLRGTFPT